MNIENNISKFQQWALGMGCPLEHIPCEEAIKSIYKSRQSQLFSELITRIQPLEQVQEARKNFVIETKRQSDNKIPIYNADITREYDAYVKVQQLKKQQQNAQKMLEQRRTEYETAIALLEAKGIHLTKAQAKQEKLQALKHIYKLKASKLDKQISQELKTAVSLANIMPLPGTRYADQELTKELVQKALNEISHFESSTEDAQVVKLKFWQEMRQILYQLPNSSIFEHITNLHMKQMQKFALLLEKNEQHVNSDRRLNNFEQALLETKIKFTEYVAQFIHAKSQREEYEETFSLEVVQFANELKEQLHCRTTTEEDLDELIRSFVYQYNFKNMKQCENKVLGTQIDALNDSIEENAKKLSGHELLLQAVKQMYLDTNVCINRILAEIKCMQNMKPKLMYPKNTFNNLVKGRNYELERKNGDFNADSFNLASESVFSSTKVDFDTTSSFLMPRATNVAELMLFMETNLNNFKSSVNSSSSLCLAQLLPSTLANNKLLGVAANLLFLAPQQALEQLANDLKWMAKISAEHVAVKTPLLQVDVVDEKLLAEQQKSQNAQLCELMDQTEATLEYMERLLIKNNKIYDFILKNSLKNYVPAKRTYKNYNFYQYEAEYRNFYAITENFL